MLLSLCWPAAPTITPPGFARARLGLALFAIGGALALGGGCPQRPRVSSIPPLELAASPDPRAESDFRSALDARKQGRTDDAHQRLRAFMDAWPNDPLVPFARLELGRIDLDRGRNAEALKWFEGVAKTQDPALSERARLYSAVAAERLGQHEHAISVLRPLLGRTVDPEETTLVLDTLGAAEQAIGDDLSALETRDHELAEELPEDQRHQVEAVVKGLIGGLDTTLELPRAYEQLPRDGYSWSLVAKRLLRVSHERADRDRVSAIAEDLSDQGVSLEEELAALVLRAERSSDADPSVIGAILPLSGRGREVGEAALQGLLLASEVVEGSHPRLVYRDDAGDPARAVEALEDLVQVHRVIAVIGPLSTGPAQAVAARAQELDVPVLSLSPDPSLNERSDGVYRLLPEPREEAGMLVQRATRAGAQRFALLHPESSFGQAMRRAFETAVETTHGSLTAVAYSPSTTNFVREAEQVAQLDVDAVILADGPARVALMAPALAAVGLWSTAPGEKPAEGRKLIYLVPSAGFDPALARTARRYLQGALFAVPFNPLEPTTFAAGYRAKFQSEPNLFAAAAHDAYRIVEAALSGGITTRDQLNDALAKVKAPNTATAVSGFSATRGPRTPLRIDILLGEAFVQSD